MGLDLAISDSEILELKTSADIISDASVLEYPYVGR